MQIKQVDYTHPQDCEDLIFLLDGYSRDPMGGGEPLKPSTKENLCKALSQREDAFSLIAYIDGKPAGLINCFEGFSTFKCKPLINIHDIAVDPDFRYQGVGQKLLQAVEDIAKKRGCCKLTLEVLEGNKPAQRAYEKFGFEGYELDPELGKAMFWEKAL